MMSPRSYPVTRGTPAVPGRTQTRDTDPVEDARSAFFENTRMLEVIDNPEPTYENSPSKISGCLEALRAFGFRGQLKSAARKLHGRVTFRGLEISIENRKGSKRHWYDPHADKHGTTTMLYPYGYIRKTVGMDGDHVDVFVGPNESATHVYVVLTNKAPEFDKADEEKCFLGFDSEADARKAFSAHYDNPKFFRSLRALTFEKFKENALATGEGERKKVAFTDDGLQPTIEGFSEPTPVTDDTKDRGLPTPGLTRWIIGEPLDKQDRIDRSFNALEIPQGNASTPEPSTEAGNLGP